MVVLSPVPRGVSYEHQGWLDGNFTLVSSDGWIIRVSSKMLFNVR